MGYPQIFLLITRLLRLVGLVSVNRFNPTSWMTVITPTDRPKSVRNRCVIGVFGSVFVLSTGFRIIHWYKGFCHRSEPDLFLFLFLFFNNGLVLRRFFIRRYKEKQCS